VADKKLSALTELATTPAGDDELYIRDVSEEASLESKRIVVTNLMAAAGLVGAILSDPPSGQCRIKNIYRNPITKEITIVWDETPEP